MFVGVQIEWYVSLVLVIDIDVDCYEGFGVVGFVGFFFFEIVRYFFVLGKVGGILVVNGFFVYVGVVNMVQGFQYFDFFIMDVVGVEIGWW